MTTIWNRSALTYWGKNPAPDVAGMITDHHGTRVITWADVLRERREEQQWRLANRRRYAEWKAYKVWVAFFNQELFGGWHAFIENRDVCHWIDRDRKSLIEPLMELFPLALPGFEQDDQWENWKRAFAQVYRRNTHDRQPRGLRIVWWDGANDLRLAHTR